MLFYMFYGMFALIFIHDNPFTISYSVEARWIPHAIAHARQTYLSTTPVILPRIVATCMPRESSSYIPCTPFL